MIARGKENWPWSALGIAETADKDAIRAAYEVARASLDGSGSISAYADLTAAREKALFLASELQRQAMDSNVDPARCDATIALLETLLAGEEPVPDALYAAL